MATASPASACKTAAGFLAILKNQATHDLAMPGAPLRTYNTFAADLEAVLTLCATEAPTVDHCAKIEDFLGDVANALLDGDLFPEAPRYWKQAFIDAIELAGMACADVTGSLAGLKAETGAALH